MKLIPTTIPGCLDSLAEEIAVDACMLADAAGPDQWSADAVEDAACAIEVLAGALAELDPDCAQILSGIPAAVAALLERTEQVRTGGAVPQTTGDRTATGTSTALRQALTAHHITQHRIHQLGPALVTVTLQPADAQALATLLAAHRELPRQTPDPEADDGWGAGPAETAAAALGQVLGAYGPSTYARVLASGQVSAGLTPRSVRQVITVLNTRPSPAAPRARRRGLGHGWKGLDSSDAE